MKEIIVIHDYLVTESIVGDWDGEEELVAERINEIYHLIYDLAEEDIEPEILAQLLSLVWPYSHSVSAIIYTMLCHKVPK